MTLLDPMNLHCTNVKFCLDSRIEYCRKSLKLICNFFSLYKAQKNSFLFTKKLFHITVSYNTTLRLLTVKNHKCQNLANAKVLVFLFLTFPMEDPKQHSISDLSSVWYYAVQTHKRLQKWEKCYCLPSWSLQSKSSN